MIVWWKSNLTFLRHDDALGHSGLGLKTVAATDAIDAVKSRLAAMQSNLQADLKAQIAEVERQREAIRGQAMDSQAVGQLYMRVHDLKGIAGVCGFPFISVLAAGICGLLDDTTRLPADQIGLVDDHLDAIRHCFATGVADAEDPRAQALAAALERDMRLR
jgi:chemotaxis protein histidine kinase CheA